MDYQPFNKIYLIKNIDIDTSYNHQYYFETQLAQYNFFYSKRFKTVEPGTYQRKNKGQIQVPFLAEEIRECKYIMWKNILKEDGTQETSDTRTLQEGWIYAFVTSIDYVNPSVSIINYQLDVYQTYLFDMEWKQSFIEREHTDRWDDDGKPVINTIPEGLDYGSEYRVTHRVPLLQIPDVSFIVIGSKQEVVSGSSQWLSNLPTNLFYYVIPVSLNNSKYVFKINNQDVTDATLILDYLFRSTTFVNSCVSAYVLPYLPVDKSRLSYTITSTSTPGISSCNITAPDLTVGSVSSYKLASFISSFIPGIYEITEATDKYFDFPNYEESKLLMYPYSFVEMTNDRGSTYIMKLELVSGEKITIGILGTISYRNKMAYLVKNYLVGASFNYRYNAEAGIYDSTSAEMPIIDDYSASYLQSNRNSIEVSRQNAQNIQNMSYKTAEANRLNAGDRIKEEGLKGIVNALGQTGEGFLKGFLGGISNPLNISGNIGQAILGTGQGLNTGLNTLISQIYDKKVANRNYSLAQQSADVTYQNEVASINAKVQDAEQVPGTVNTMGSEYIFDVAYGHDGVYLYKKTILPEYASKLTDYFKHYGYKVNKLENPQFKTREHWNYIKMSEPNVNGNIPMDDLFAIKGIFSNGITLWHGDYIGNYNQSNNELSGVARVVGTEARITFAGYPSGVNVSMNYYSESAGEMVDIDSGDLVPIGSMILVHVSYPSGLHHIDSLLNGVSVGNIGNFVLTQNSHWEEIYG